MHDFLNAILTSNNVFYDQYPQYYDEVGSDGRVFFTLLRKRLKFAPIRKLYFGQFRPKIPVSDGNGFGLRPSFTITVTILLMQLNRCKLLVIYRIQNNAVSIHLVHDNLRFLI